MTDSALGRYVDKMTDPGNDNHGVVQVVFTPRHMPAFRAWLARRGAQLTPMPNGHDTDGNPVLDSKDDLPTFGIGRL